MSETPTPRNVSGDAHESPKSFAALRHPQYRIYFITTALAMMADNIEHVISYWVLYQKFHSPTLAGIAIHDLHMLRGHEGRQRGTQRDQRGPPQRRFIQQRRSVQELLHLFERRGRQEARQGGRGQGIMPRGRISAATRS